MNEIRDTIFISHRKIDSAVADMIKDFLVNTGIPIDKIFCSSLPGNDVAEKIAPEVKANLKKAKVVFYVERGCKERYQWQEVLISHKQL